MQLSHANKLFDKHCKSYKGKQRIESDMDAVLLLVTKRALNEICLSNQCVKR